MGRAPRTKETLPDFLKWRRVTRPLLIFRGLTGSQRILGFWGVTTTTRHRYMAGNLTQWYFHRVQEHPKQSSNEKVMTFQSWRSHITRQPYSDSLPYLPEFPFPASSSTHCPPQTSELNLDSMGFPYSLRTPETESRRESYDLPKLEVTHD